MLTSTASSSKIFSQASVTVETQFPIASDNVSTWGTDNEAFIIYAAGGPTSATAVAAPGGRPAATERVAAVLETAVPPDRDFCINRLEDRCSLMATVMTSRRRRVTSPK